MSSRRTLKGHASGVQIPAIRLLNQLMKHPYIECPHCKSDDLDVVMDPMDSNKSWELAHPPIDKRMEIKLIQCLKCMRIFTR